jgi:hypothetical protein
MLQLRLLVRTAALACVFVGVGLASTASAETVHHWKMDAWTGDTLWLGGAPDATHGVADAANAPGQGTLPGFSGDPNVANDPLFVWGPMEDPGQGGGALAFSSETPPAYMLNGITSAQSYDFNSVIGIGGQMFYAADQYGNEYAGEAGDSFTAEVFFKSTGETEGIQTLLWAKEFHAGSHIQLNTPPSGPGGIEFWGWDGFALTGISLTTADRPEGFNDGLWHYAAARYDADTNNMSLLVISEDGDINLAEQTLVADLILSGGNNNMFVGRQEGEVNRFAGLIDELRLSTGYVADGDLIGIPEPASLALLALGGCLVLRRRR